MAKKVSRSVSTGLFFAALFAVVKCILFLSGKHEAWYNAVPIVNIGFVMMACGLGMWLSRDTQGNLPQNALDRIRAGMRSGMMYALFTAIFVFVYYNNVDKRYVQHRIEERVSYARNLDYEKLKKENPEKLSDKSHNEFIQDEKEQAELWYSPFMNATLSLTGLMVSALLYSVALSFIFRWLFMQRKHKISK